MSPPHEWYMDIGLRLLVCLYQTGLRCLRGKYGVHLRLGLSVVASIAIEVNFYLQINLILLMKSYIMKWTATADEVEVILFCEKLLSPRRPLPSQALLRCGEADCTYSTVLIDTAHRS